MQNPESNGLGACRTLVVDSENRPQRGHFSPDSPPHGCSMGQEAGEKGAAADDSPLLPPGALQPTIPKSDRLLGQEWVTLQNNHEQYEKGALLIKLLAVLLCGLGFVLALHEVVMALLLMVLWLQEGIYRTSQSRLGMRIARIEQGIESGEVAPFQLHSEWLAARPGMLGLLAEYGASALRPTVAFPYALLLVLIGGLVVLAGG